ncbi:asparagine-rich antigen Pfa55-14, putative [Plasmodium gallinaceum]|uniref:histone acetyltransferase n=1 Tax=Plasmodium gallinaceum TaxID=5849 RepID=A0A1J1GYQ0_PLAGA|nr:asparagine-rich antigen Pfa55-14, putative [Plasmodium gallinaceum]CRG97692.1 asparagine-rich antigen Pfa55-14, putative [Plasmodium gallinaceum]
MDKYNENNCMNSNFLNSNSSDENVNIKNKKKTFNEFKYDKVVSNVFSIFKKNNKHRYISTSSALRNDIHEQNLTSRIFLDLYEDRVLLLHKILKKINILNLIYFRFLKDDDIEDVFDLHREIFPVKYHADFYFSICNFDDNKSVDDDIIRISEKITNLSRNNINNKKDIYNNYKVNDHNSLKINNNNLNNNDMINENTMNNKNVVNSINNSFKIDLKKNDEINLNDKNYDDNNITNEKLTSSETFNPLNNENNKKKKINKKWKEEQIFSVGAFLPYSFIDYINSNYISKLLKNKSIEKISEKEILLDYIKFIDDNHNYYNSFNHTHINSFNYEDQIFKSYTKYNSNNQDKDKINSSNNVENKKCEEEKIFNENSEQNKKINALNHFENANINFNNDINHKRLGNNKKEIGVNTNEQDMLEKDDLQMCKKSNNNNLNNNLEKNNYKKEDNVDKCKSINNDTNSITKNDYVNNNKINSLIYDEKISTVSDLEEINNNTDSDSSKNSRKNSRKNINNYNKTVCSTNNTIHENNNEHTGSNSVDKYFKNNMKEKICLSKEIINLYNMGKTKTKKDYLIGSISTLINYEENVKEKDFNNIYNFFKKKSNNCKKGKNYLKYVYDSSINFLESYFPVEKNGNINEKEKKIGNSNSIEKKDEVLKNTDNELKDDEQNSSSSNMRQTEYNNYNLMKMEPLISVNNTLNDLTILKKKSINKDLNFEKKIYEEIYMNKGIKKMAKKYIKKKINSVYILTVGINEYFRGLSLASFLIEYTLFFFYFIIFRIFLYDKRFYCYVDNKSFYSLSCNLKDEHNGIFDEGVISDDFSDDFESNLYGKNFGIFQEKKHIDENQNEVDEKIVNYTEKEIYNSSKKFQKIDEFRKGELINEIDVNEKNSEYDGSNESDNMKKGKKNIKNNLCKELICSSNGANDNDHELKYEKCSLNIYNLNKTNDFNDYKYIGKYNTMNNNTFLQKVNNCKEAKKNYSICNSIIRHCYKKIISNDYLHHLYDIIHNRNSENKKIDQIKKKVNSFHIFNFPQFKNPVCGVSINNKILNFFFSNFSAHYLKDRPFFHFTNSKCMKSSLPSDNENIKLPLYMYLHVIDYNKAAINLYNKLNFDYICTYDNFYEINKISFSSYLYAYFF